MRSHNQFWLCGNQSVRCPWRYHRDLHPVRSSGLSRLVPEKREDDDRYDIRFDPRCGIFYLHLSHGSCLIWDNRGCLLPEPFQLHRFPESNATHLLHDVLLDSDGFGSRFSVRVDVK